MTGNGPATPDPARAYVETRIELADSGFPPDVLLIVTEDPLWPDAIRDLAAASKPLYDACCRRAVLHVELGTAAGEYTGSRRK